MDRRRYVVVRRRHVTRLVVLLISIFMISTYIFATHDTTGLLDQGPITWIPIDLANVPIGTAYNYTYSDAKRYKGPVLADWPLNQSRYLSAYMDPNFPSVQTDLSCLDLTGTRLLLMIQTSPANIARRNDNRNTWMNFLKDFPHVKALFVMGLQVEKSNETIDLEEEQRLHCDLLQFDFLDTYGNVTLDSMSAIQFALLWAWHPEIPPDFVVIMDDDNYLYLPRLWKILFTEKIISAESKRLYGSLIQKAKIQSAPSPNMSSILYPPAYLYDNPKRTYPDYLSGTFYILPRATLACIYATAFHIPIFPINDVYVTGMLAEACQYERRKMAGIHGFTYDRLTNYRPGVSFLFHYMNGREKFAMHNVFTQHQGKIFYWKRRERYFTKNNDIYYCDKQLKCDKIRP